MLHSPLIDVMIKPHRISFQAIMWGQGSCPAGRLSSWSSRLRGGVLLV
jgi:hypothetical protein